MKPSRDIARLLEIMAALRDPETGCPWDLEQDFSTIRHYTIEEAYEVADAIERQDFDDLKDELGDLLLQPVYHAQMAAEAAKFDFGDVVQAITEKLIRRHPHVFGDTAAKEAKSAKARWDEIKAVERSQKSSRRSSEDGRPASILDDVPRALPALARAQRLDKRAASVGFDWADSDDVLAKCREEIVEVSEALASGRPEKISEEIGDLLLAVTSLARHAGIDAESALTDANAKFIRRFHHVEQRCLEDGTPIELTGMETLDRYWNEIRAREAQAAAVSKR